MAHATFHAEYVTYHVHERDEGHGVDIFVATRQGTQRATQQCETCLSFSEAQGMQLK